MGSSPGHFRLMGRLSHTEIGGYFPAMSGSEQLAELVLSLFQGRAGFDAWWDSLSPEFQEALKTQLAELLSP